MMTAIGSASSGLAEARAWAMRSVRSSRFGSPVAGSYSAPRCASSTSLALSSTIEASWAKRDRASISRARNGRPLVPEASPMTPTTSSPLLSGTPTTAPRMPMRDVRGALLERVVVVDGERARPVPTTRPPTPSSRSR